MPATIEKPKLQAGKQKVPREAFRFRVPLEMQFAEDEAQLTKAPVTLLARTPEPIDHWYWGTCVHDFAGMQTKERIPLDWCHYYGVNVGYADEFSIDNKKGLTVSGEIISTRDGDQASEILARGRAGVPYEASIDFHGSKRVEYVGEGMQAKVNGQTFTGPLTIFREWSLKAVAVCPFGADGGTSTQFADGRDRAPEADVEFTLFCENPDMATDTKPADQKPAEQLKETPAPAPAAPPATDPAAAFKATLQKFVAEFGAENGSKWAAESLSYESALKQHADALAAQLKSSGDAKDKEIEELKAKLAAIPRGEETPASFNDAGKPTPPSGGDVKSLACKLGENIGKVAAAIKLPGKA